jgi:hypothetical protein
MKNGTFVEEYRTAIVGCPTYLGIVDEGECSRCLLRARPLSPPLFQFCFLSRRLGSRLVFLAPPLAPDHDGAADGVGSALPQPSMRVSAGCSSPRRIVGCDHRRRSEGSRL